MSGRVVVTGANSAVGQVVIERALEREGFGLVAAVRSTRAAKEVPPIPSYRGHIAQVDYGDVENLAFAFEDATGIIHLPGLLIENEHSTYEQANVETTRAAVDAARQAGVGKFVLVSAVGADVNSANRYFQTKGEAERIVQESGLTYTILRAPMVLACRSHGVRALVRETGQSRVPLMGGGRHHDQPIDARDLADGALNAAERLACAENRVLDIVGPESLPMAELVRRGAEIRGLTAKAMTIPTSLVKMGLGVKQRFAKGGMTPEVIEVMVLDVRLDPKPATQALGIELQTLEDTLRYSLELWEAI